MRRPSQQLNMHEAIRGKLTYHIDSTIGCEPNICKYNEARSLKKPQEQVNPTAAIVVEVPHHLDKARRIYNTIQTQISYLFKAKLDGEDEKER